MLRTDGKSVFLGDFFRDRGAEVGNTRARRVAGEPRKRGFRCGFEHMARRIEIRLPHLEMDAARYILAEAHDLPDAR